MRDNDDAAWARPLFRALDATGECPDTHTAWDEWCYYLRLNGNREPDDDCDERAPTA